MYLNNTVEFGIKYVKGASTVLAAYSLTSWADDAETRRSVGGYTVLVAKGVISWRSKRQSLVATSTTESEMIAAAETTEEVLSLRKPSRTFSFPPVGPTIIFEDNQAAIAISQNPTAHGRTKHFDVAQFFFRETTTTPPIS
jgi:hypothetical protein